MYTLNLLFDLAETAGVYSQDQPGPGPLVKSATWLRLPALNPPGLNAETAPWQNLDKARNLLIPNAIGEAVCMRVAAIATSNPALDPHAVLTLSVGFGAPRIAAQRNSSPFRTPTGEVIASFVFSGTMNSAPAAGAAPVAWFFPLSTIQIGPNNVNKPHRFEFVVSAIVNSAGTIRTYGIDPEMDVGL